MSNVLYYAMGGGLGHLTRAQAVIHTLGLPRERLWILSASPLACSPYLSEKIKLLSPPPHFARDLPRYQHWLAEQLETYHIREVYLDTFPAGIVGEWNGFLLDNSLAFYHIARLLRWNRYLALLAKDSPYFQKTYEVETLAHPHHLFLKNRTDLYQSLHLNYPTCLLAASHQEHLQKLKQQNEYLHLIVHSNPEELPELLAYARAIDAHRNQKAHYLIACPEQIPLPEQDLATYEFVNFYPASSLFPWVDQITSACGFNVMQETLAYRHLHTFLPFERRYDHQYLRAKRHRDRSLSSQDDESRSF